jgi:hypothetical protein
MASSRKSNPSVAEPTSHNALRVPGCTINSGTAHHYTLSCWITPSVCLNLPHVQYECLGDAMSALGPEITQLTEVQ